VGDARLRAGVRGVWGAEDVSAAWAAGVLAVGAWSAAVAGGGEGLAMSQHQRESWAERVAIMVTDGSVRRADAERLAWAGLQPSSDARCGARRVTTPRHPPQHLPSAPTPCAWLVRRAGDHRNSPSQAESGAASRALVLDRRHRMG
jgi:hypothetical protein